MKMMDIYVQETMALQYMKMIPDSARLQVLQVALFFHQVLSRSIVFSDAIIPETIWFFLHSKWKTLYAGENGQNVGSLLGSHSL